MYTKDLLSGPEFECFEITLRPDYDGQCCCTLIRLVRQKRFDKSVLYIHGFSDYFFHKELAERFYSQGYNFYALDLRKSGRSIRPGQNPYFFNDIREYFEDIEAAVKVIKSENGGKIVCFAHSLGALTAALYCNEHKNTFSALLLNSPFLEINKSGFTKKVLIPLAAFFGKFFPYIKIKKAYSPFYGRSVHKDFYGEWSFDKSIKPVSVPFVRLGWLRAVHKAQKTVRKGLSIPAPVLVMRSSASFKSKTWNDNFLKADAVLNVDDIERHGKKLGNNVTIAVIKDGMHDLVLSMKPVRDEVYKQMFAWLKKTDRQ